MSYTIEHRTLEESGADVTFITLDNLLNPATGSPIKIGIVRNIYPPREDRRDRLHGGMLELIGNYSYKIDIALLHEYSYELDDSKTLDEYLLELQEASKGNDVLIVPGTFVGDSALNDLYVIQSGEIIHSHTKYSQDIDTVNYFGLKVAIIICSERDFPYEGFGIDDADLSITVAHCSIGFDLRCLKEGGYAVCADGSGFPVDDFGGSYDVKYNPPRLTILN